MKFSGSDAVISPENGGIINFGGNIESQQDIDWKIDITGPDFAGKTISGGGPSVAAEWDGKDENGKVAEPGLYTATLTASDINGECSDTKEISFAVEPSENSCALLVNFGSSANVTSGNLSHSQTLFSTKTGGVALHYNSLEGYDGPLGTGWNHSYDIFLKDSGSSVMLREGDGHKKLFTLTGEGYISQPGDYSTLVRNADGGYTLFKKDGTRYDFGADGKVASITDRNGGAVSFAYEEGMLVSVADQYDRTTGFQYNAGRLSGIEDPAGNVYTFIVDGSLASVIYPDGGAWSYTYDGNGFMLTKTDPAGYTTHYEYDSERRAVRSTDPEGGVKSVEYPGGAEGVRTTTVVEKDGGVWRYTYDTQAGTLTGKTDPEGGATSYTYDASGNMLTRTEPDGSVTSYAYDAYGNTTSVTDAAGQTTRYAYNEFGQVTSVIGPEGNATANEYDANGNLLSITDPSGARTMYTYNAQGHITSVTDAMGQTTTFGYDQYGNRVSTTDPTGAITSFVYDEQGNMTSQTDANGAITRYEYDAAGRLVKVIDPTGNETSYTYDINGNRASQTDANGNTTFYEYNYKGQLVKVTDALGNTTTYAYGGAGCASCSGGGEALTSVTDANGNTTKYEYDSLGRKVKEIDPLGDVTSFSYNSRGVMASRSDANGSTITFNYDIKDRLITKTYSDGTNDIFTYDTKGNITFAANQYASYTYTYDVLDRATSVTDSAGKSISYEYDKLGNRTKTVAPDGSATSYVYDLGRLSEIKSFAGSFTFAYDALGRRTRLSMPNGTTANYSYNMTGNLTNLVHKPSSGPAFASFAYTHDKIGNRLTKTETETKYSYSYDKLYQLIQSLPTKLNGKDKMQENKAETFSYDRLGNRLSGPDTKDVYSYGTGNQLLSDRKNKYQYDKNGNLISRTETDDGGRIISWTCEYDFESKLTRVTKAASEEAIVVSFKYDPFGKRIEKKIEKTENGITEKKIYNYIYDNEDIIAEYLTKDDGKDEATRYVHGPGIDEPLAIERNKEVYYYHADGLGSIVALTDSKQRAVEKYDYDSFGNVKRNGDKVKNTFTYTGREWDEEIGYYYNRARYYDPRAGRFVSKDPIGFEGGINFYVYTANNPVSFIDPTGFKLISLQEGIAIVNNAKTWLGVPYQSPWNASNPRLGIDCSRLVWKVYNEVGFTYSYASTSSFASLENFEKVNAPQEGDVALYNGHMGIYTNGQLLSARSGLGKVGMSPLTWYGPMKGYYRYDKCN